MDNIENYLHQKRKTNKPLTEKRRRERINNSLQQLKTLVLQGTNKEDNMKLEKADIMDMTVRYIEDLQHKQLTKDIENAQLAMTSYIQGYSSCINEVSRALSAHCLTSDIRSTISNHLSSSLYTFKTGCFQQDFYSTPSRPLSRASNFSDDRRTTITPYSYSSADDNISNQLSPILLSSTSPSTVWAFASATSYNCHSAGEQSISISSDSGVRIDSPSADSSVWRPW